MTYVVINKILTDVVTLAEAKSFLRITSTSEDALIQSLINSAVTQAERIMNRDILTTTYENFRNSFFQDLTLRRGAYQSVESIEYLSDGSYVVLDPTEYTVTIGGSFGVVCEIDTPTCDAVCNSVKITFKTGFGDDATFVPEDIKTAIKMIVSDMYANRGDCSDGSGNCSKCSAGSQILSSYYLAEIV